MTTYVLGAGASYPVYPLASRLLKSINDYVAECGKFVDRFDYESGLRSWRVSKRAPIRSSARRIGTGLRRVAQVPLQGEGLEPPKPWVIYSDQTWLLTAPHNEYSARQRGIADQRNSRVRNLIESR